MWTFRGMGSRKAGQSGESSGRGHRAWRQSGGMVFSKRPLFYVTCQLSIVTYPPHSALTKPHERDYCPILQMERQKWLSNLLIITANDPGMKGLCPGPPQTDDG